MSLANLFADGFDVTVATADDAFIRRCYKMAEQTIVKEAEYIEQQLRRYKVRRARLKKLWLPTVAWCGWGRAGKDEAGEWLSEHSKDEILYAGGGNSLAAAPLIGSALGVPAHEAYRDRHSCRMFWFHFLNGLRDIHGQTTLVKMTLATSDTVTGIRSGLELRSAQTEGLIDRVVWVHRPGVPQDFTVEYDELDCQYAVINGGTLQEYHDKLRRLCGEKFSIQLQEAVHGQEEEARVE